MSPLEERLLLPEDAAAIRTLDATHGRLLDDGDWPALVALFTEDGVFDGLSGCSDVTARTPPTPEQ